MFFGFPPDAWMKTQKCCNKLRLHLIADMHFPPLSLWVSPFKGQSMQTASIWTNPGKAPSGFGFSIISYFSLFAEQTWKEALSMGNNASYYYLSLTNAPCSTFSPVTIRQVSASRIHCLFYESWDGFWMAPGRYWLDHMSLFQVWFSLDIAEMALLCRARSSHAEKHWLCTRGSA